MPNGSKLGETRGTISETSAKTLLTQEEKAKQYNVAKVLRISPCNPLSKGPVASYKRKDMGGIADDLVALWEIVKNDSPVYQKIERERERERERARVYPA